MTPSIFERRPLLCVAGVLASYTLGFFAFYPNAITNSDEASYIRHAQSVAKGELVLRVEDPLTKEVSEISLNRPAGTALVLAPFVRAFGWRGAFVGPLLLLAIATLATAVWLRGAGCSPLFATLLPVFPAALVLGRVPNSDLGSAACVAIGMAAFFRGATAPSARPWLAAGFIAGLSPLFREPTVLVFAPLFLGAALRRERRVWALVVGGVVGLALPMASAAAIHGDPLFLRTGGLGYSFSFEHLATGVLFYGAVLLVLVPGGAIATLLYRGPRRPELMVAVFGVALFHAAYGYSGEESGTLRRVVLGGRFMLPILPLLIFQLAWVLPGLFESLAVERPWLVPLKRRLVPLALVAAAGVGFAVHPAFARWSMELGEIQRLIYAHTTPEIPIVTDGRSSFKFLNGVIGTRITSPGAYLNPAAASFVLERFGSFTLMLVERQESEYWRRRRERNEAFVRQLGAYDLERVVDFSTSGGERLRIWQVRPREPAGPGGAGPAAGGTR